MVKFIIWKVDNMKLIEYMRQRNKMTQKEWEASFHKEEKEIIILRHEGGGGSLRNGFWDWAAYFLAFVDCESGQLYKEEGRIEYPVIDKEALPIEFDDETIYKLRVREKMDEEVPEGVLPSKNHFLLVEVLEKNVSCPELEAILEEYRKPVILHDDLLGELVYNRQIKTFEGSVLWQDEKIYITLDVNKDNKGGITRGKNALKAMISNQSKWDEDLPYFAAKSLIKCAREWDESDARESEISGEDFAKRIRISSIWMTSGGSFSVYFDDDDIFFGHTIRVSGSLKKGLVSANIEG